MKSKSKTPSKSAKAPAKKGVGALKKISKKELDKVQGGETPSQIWGRSAE